MKVDQRYNWYWSRKFLKTLQTPGGLCETLDRLC